jgi:hypothetical protein
LLLCVVVDHDYDDYVIKVDVVDDEVVIDGDNDADDDYGFCRLSTCNIHPTYL